ncbi:ThiF family adenylyltransferase [Cellulomonas composti]|uniref:Adenylyltransferase/sulfurtransferase MoeZ n=1 Tax=Cellulomonas composti TaxID=266130 RepID=A0A511JDJ3_9CELL|nr:ThiF family adenylyltransferase [Cellulomonas composti]GEL96070.1 adenylyltransferase/sulfurtransferase MoeZ [Cellulomonas composti]
MRIAPLVEPGPPLGPEQAERASRHLLLPGVGLTGQRRLRAARVCVVGAGGLGAPVLQYLAAAGVGTIGIVDDDVVDVSNLQRQVVHGSSDVGRPKVDSARDAVLALDPTIVVRTHDLRLTATNAPDVLADYDLVVDGSDNFPTRYVVSDAAAAAGLPVVWGSVLRFDAQVAVFWATAPGGGPTLRDLFPTPSAPDEVPSCAEAGVLGALCGQVGSVMATEVVKLVCGIGEPLLGRVLVLDALRARWSQVPLVVPKRSDERPADPAPTTVDADEVPEIRPDELAARLADPADPVVVIDVREPAEIAVAAMPGAVPVPLASVLDGSALRDWPYPGPVVVLCHVGARSRLAAQVLRSAGIDATNLAGGIVAWRSSELATR